MPANLGLLAAYGAIAVVTLAAMGIVMLRRPGAISRKLRTDRRLEADEISRKSLDA